MIYSPMKMVYVYIHLANKRREDKFFVNCTYRYHRTVEMGGNLQKKEAKLKFV